VAAAIYFAELGEKPTTVVYSALIIGAVVLVVTGGLSVAILAVCSLFQRHRQVVASSDAQSSAKTVARIEMLTRHTMGGRAREKMAEFRSNLYNAARSEHTLLNFVAPPDDEEAITEAQVVQIFWNTLSVELVILCLMYEPAEPGGEEEPMPLVTTFIGGTIAAGTAFGSVFLTRRIFMWGNSRLTRPSKLLARIRRVRKRLTRGVGAEKTVESAPRKGQAIWRDLHALHRAGGKGIGAIDVHRAANLALKQKRVQMGRRSKRSYHARTMLAWAAALACFTVCAMMAVVYGRLFGPSRTNDMLLGWLLATGQTWAVLEPLQIVIVAALPVLVSQESCVMRTYERARYIYNEYLA
jgi:hypothetical protein